MRWSGQQVLEDGVGAEAALPGLRGLLRSVRTPEFAGTVFHEVEARSALNRVPGSSPMPFRWTVTPYRGCSHACVYCLAGDTRVLMADGSTRPIARLQVGDVVIGTERIDGRRRYVPTAVTAHWSTTRPAVRVRLAGGTEIVASGEHRFLTDRGWRHVTGGWCRSGRRPRLRPGAALLGPGPFAAGPDDGGREHSPGYRRGYLCGLVHGDVGRPVAAEPDRVFPSAHLELEVLGRAHHYLSVEKDRRSVPVLAAVGGGVDGRIAPPLREAATHLLGPVDEMARWPERPGRDWCTGFLAGVLDARGSTGLGELRLRHTDEEVVGRIAGALHRLGFRFAMEPGGRAHGEPERVVQLLGGAGAFVRFLQLTGPAVARGRDLGGAAVEAAESMRVVSVEPTGRDEPMYDITTGTGDFVAEGVVSHNCFARGTPHLPRPRRRGRLRQPDRREGQRRPGAGSRWAPR